MHVRTPLIKSEPMSKLAGRPIWLKLECLQASGSFKDRGMGHLCCSLSKQGKRKLIGSSGGNAGLALATMGKRLGFEIVLVVPSSTKQIVIERLEELGVKVTIHGSIWNEADLLARQMVEEDPEAAYVSPYDNPLLWTGHATIVEEIWREFNTSIGTIILSVGGGGLLCGVLEGLEPTGFSTRVLTCETEGANSFANSWNQGDGREVIKLEGISSIATSLGALEVTPVALERAHEHKNRERCKFVSL